MSYRAPFNSVGGLTRWVNNRLTLSEMVKEWCSENLCYIPSVDFESMKGSAIHVWITFKNEHDYLLFRLHYSNHFLR